MQKVADQLAREVKGARKVVVSGAGLASPASRVSALALGFSLIAAALSGTLVERVHLPRVTGYLLFGLICGPGVANIIQESMARDLQIANGLAIAVRRASDPSTPSSIVLSSARTAATHAAGSPAGSQTSAAVGAIKAARKVVTAFAAPKTPNGWCAPT